MGIMSKSSPWELFSSAVQFGALGGGDDHPHGADGETGWLKGSVGPMQTDRRGSMQRERQAHCVGLACPLAAAVRGWSCPSPL